MVVVTRSHRLLLAFRWPWPTSRHSTSSAVLVTSGHGPLDVSSRAYKITVGQFGVNDFPLSPRTVYDIDLHEINDNTLAAICFSRII